MVTTDLIRSSLRLIGAISSSETPASDETMDALEALNLLLSSWGASRFLSKNTQTITHTLTGATSYTIGRGGDIDTIRPSAIFTAYYTLGGLDYPLQVLDYKTYSEIGTKNIGSIPEYVVLKPDYPLSTIYVFPVGSGGVLTLSAVRPQVELDINDDVQDIYPPEWIRALKYNLAVEIAPEYGVTVSPEIAALARESKDIVMRSMVSIPSANFDPLLGCGNRGGNILGGFY
jgi:hypothetical protein